jgi:hypothetical protein
MEQLDTDTEANLPLRKSADNSTQAVPRHRANKLNSWVKVAILIVAVLIVIVNLWANLRKGEGIAEASATALAGIARAVAAAVQESGIEWKNMTGKAV